MPKHKAGRSFCWSMILIFCLLLNAFVGQPMFAQSAVESSIVAEGRCIWLDRGTIVQAYNEAGVAALFDKLKAAGFNVIYFEVNNAGYTMFKSEIGRRSALVREDFDPLAVACAEAHKRGMELHAWFWAFNVGNIQHNQLQGVAEDFPGPVIDAHGQEWALRDKDGKMVPPDQHEYWISPANPDACNYVKTLAVELVSHYDLDGVQLDYIRFPFQKPGQDMGFDAASRTRFEKETGLSLTRLDKRTRQRWNEWKRDLVNNFVESVSAELRQLKPKLIISAAVFPFTHAQRMNAIQQEWETWVTKGWVDVLNPMTYAADVANFRAAVKVVVAACHGHGKIYPGVAIGRCGRAGLLIQLEEARQLTCAGVTIFACAQMDDQSFKLLCEGPFKDPVPPAHKKPETDAVVAWRKD